MDRERERETRRSEIKEGPVRLSQAPAEKLSEKKREGKSSRK
jgi:hypothetical protein